MATYRMLQPGLAEVQRDDGQSMVLPLDEASAQAQGLQPAGLQLPSAPNPYSMIGSGQAVAGPGGGAPTDLGTGAGVFAQPSASYGRGVATPQQQVQQDAQALAERLQTPVPTSHPSNAQASKFDVQLPPGSVGGAAPGLVRVGGGARGEVPRETGASGQIDPLIAAVMREGGGGGGPRRLGVTSETRKYHEAGPVDPALAAEIKTGQEQLDQSRSNQLEDEALHRGDFLEEQEKLQQQQAQQIQAAMQRRQAVDNEIQRLNMRSQQAQDELMNAKPKQVDQFWKDKGVAAQIGAAVAMTLGAWGATMGRTENMGAKVLDQTIDRWMNDQIQQYNVAKDKATLSNNAYKDAIEIYGSPELAQTNLQLQALAAKDALIKTHAEQVGTQDALGQAQLALQESQLQRKQLQAQAQAQAGADVEAKLTIQNTGGGKTLAQRIHEGAQAKKDLDEIYGTAETPEKKDARERQIRIPGGGIVWTNSAVKGKELQDVITGNEQAIDIGARMQNLLDTGAATNLDKRKELKGLSTRFLSAVSAAEKQGVVTKADAEQAQATLADPNAILSDGGAGLRATISAIQGGLQKHIANNTYSDPQATQPYGSAGATSFKAGL